MQHHFVTAAPVTHTGLAYDTGLGTKSGTAAGKSKMSLSDEEDEETPFLAGTQTASQPLSKQATAGSQSSGDDIAGPVVKGNCSTKLLYNLSHVGSRVHVARTLMGLSFATSLLVCASLCSLCHDNVTPFAAAQRCGFARMQCKCMLLGMWRICPCEACSMLVFSLSFELARLHLAFSHCKPCLQTSAQNYDGLD